MPSIQGCDLPEDLYYDVDGNTWVRLDPGGVVTLGMTAYAVSLSGQIVAYRPKPVGHLVKRGRSAADIESGLWKGPVRTPIAGEMVAANPDLGRNPALINEDPYGYGWIAKLRPLDWNSDHPLLIRGVEAAEAFRHKMASDGFDAC